MRVLTVVFLVVGLVGEVVGELPLVKVFCNEEEKFLACRVFDGCLRGDGRVVLPLALKEYEHLLIRCDDRLEGKMEFRDVTKANASKAFHVDVFGRTAHRVHFPHFLSGFVSDILALEMVFGESKRNTISSTCIFSDGEKPCKRYEVTPGVMIQEGLKRPNAPVWIKKFVRLFGPEPDGPVLLDYSELWREKESEELVCYDSILLYGRFQGSLQPILRQHHAFNKNHIAKAPKALKDEDQCKVTVRIMDREGDDSRQHDTISKRTFENVTELESGLNAALQSLGDSVRSDVKIVYFEKMDFDQQVAAMQESDIVVAVHGAGLTNMIFMREGSHVLEMVPFTYFPSIFRDFGTQHLGVSSLQISAEPDFLSYATCIRKWMKPKDAQYDLALSSIANFHEVGEQWLREHAQDPTVMPSLKTDSSKYPFHRTCGRAQHLKVNVDFVADQVASIARGLCSSWKHNSHR